MRLVYRPTDIPSSHWSVWSVRGWHSGPESTNAHPAESQPSATLLLHSFHLPCKARLKYCAPAWPAQYRKGYRSPRPWELKVERWKLKVASRCYLHFPLSTLHFPLSTVKGIAVNCVPRSKRLYYPDLSLSAKHNPSKNLLFPVSVIQTGNVLQPQTRRSSRQTRLSYREDHNIRFSPSARPLPGKSYLHIPYLRQQAFPSNRYIGRIRFARQPETVPDWVYLLSGRKKTRKSG